MNHWHDSKPAQPQSTSSTSELLAAAVGAFRFPALESHRRRHSVLTSWVGVDFRNPPSWIQTGTKRVQEKTSLERRTNKGKEFSWNFNLKMMGIKNILKILKVPKCPPWHGAQEPLSCACLSAPRSRDGLGRLTLWWKLEIRLCRWCFCLSYRNQVY